MYDVEEIKENYKRFSDSEIEKIAINESKGLRKEVLFILKDEIEKWDLDKNLITWVEAETNTLTDLERQSLKCKIENLECPNCGLKRTNLTGQEFNTIISLIIWCHQTTKNRILCFYCGRQKKVNSFLTTAFAGWWSGHGFF